MNSETQLLVKLTYAESVCNLLATYPDMRHALPTLDWMSQCSYQVIKFIMGTAGKKGASWARVADRCKDHLRTLIPELEASDKSPKAAEYVYLYTLSVMTHILVDAYERAKNKRYLLEDLVTGAVALEELVYLGKGEAVELLKDDIRIAASSFVERLYQKMEEV